VQNEDFIPLVEKWYAFYRAEKYKDGRCTLRKKDEEILTFVFFQGHSYTKNENHLPSLVFL